MFLGELMDSGGRHRAAFIRSEFHKPQWRNHPQSSQWIERIFKEKDHLADSTSGYFRQHSGESSLAYQDRLKEMKPLMQRIMDSGQPKAVKILTQAFLRDERDWQRWGLQKPAGSICSDSRAAGLEALRKLTA